MMSTNGLKVEPGVCYTTGDGKRYRIKRVQLGLTVIEDLQHGTELLYGTEALKRLLLECSPADT